MNRVCKACAVMLVLLATSTRVAAQSAQATDEWLADLHAVRVSMARLADENVEMLRDFQFNRALGAVCVYDINGMLDELAGQMRRIEALVRAEPERASPDGVLPILIRVDVETAIGGIAAKRKRAQLSVQVCGTVPIVSARSQVAVAMLDQAERALARFR